MFDEIGLFFKSYVFGKNYKKVILKKLSVWLALLYTHTYIYEFFILYDDFTFLIIIIIIIIIIVGIKAKNYLSSLGPWPRA